VKSLGTGRIGYDIDLSTSLKSVALELFSGSKGEIEFDVPALSMKGRVWTGRRSPQTIKHYDLGDFEFFEDGAIDDEELRESQQGYALMDNLEPDTGVVGYVVFDSASHHPEQFLCLDIGYGPSPKFEVIGDHVFFLLIEEVGLLDGEQKRLLHRRIGVGVRATASSILSDTNNRWLNGIERVCLLLSEVFENH